MKSIRRRRILALTLIVIWLAILLDCVIINAREACYLAGGMVVTLLPLALSGLRARVLRRIALVLTTALHLFVVGMIAFMMIYAGSHGATGTESDRLFLLGSDLRDDRPGQLYQARIDTARRCLEEDASAAVIICGGLTGMNTVTEAEAARRALTESGIAPERIICEDRSARTLDNFNYAAGILEHGGNWDRHQTTAVITNRFHFYRASRLAKAAGYESLRLIPADASLPVELPWTLREVLTISKFWVYGPN